MLEMKNCTDFAKYKKHIPQNCIAPVILESVDKDVISGFIIFEYSPSELVIYNIEFADDIALCDGLVRAAMFKSFLNGIALARFELSDSYACDTVKKLGFIKDNMNVIDIDSVLGGCKGCKGSQFTEI